MRKSCKYTNPYIKNLRRGLIDVILWQMGYYNDILPRALPPKGFSYPLPPSETDPAKPCVTWINHCTFFIEIDGVRILTDPIWSKRCSPLQSIGPKRTHAPPIALNDLPKIDCILISHNHYDHLDAPTVKILHEHFPNIKWIVPKGVKNWFSKRKIHNVDELNWWEESLITFRDLEIKITSVPCQHYSGRGLFDTNQTLWMGHVLEFLREKKVYKTLYFVGDTAYNPFDFKKIGAKFPKIDLSLCPIGTYTPGRFMRTVHSNPKDAVNIHQDVKANLSIGMHWKTFQLASEGIDQPPFDLYTEMKKSNLNPLQFLAIEPGVTINW